MVLLTLDSFGFLYKYITALPIPLIFNSSVPRGGNWVTGVSGGLPGVRGLVGFMGYRDLKRG